MEPNSHIFNEREECHSSESGWTMYIGSPSNGEDDEMNYNMDFDEDDEYVRRDHKNINDDDDDTDDSMASDASSGPSHIVRNANKSTPVPKEKGYGKGGSNNKASMKKGSSIKNQDKGEYSVLSAKGAKVPSNGEKVKKNSWKGKGK